MVKELTLPQMGVRACSAEGVAIGPADPATGYYIGPTGDKYFYDADLGQWYLCRSFMLVPLSQSQVDAQGLVFPQAWEYVHWTGVHLGNINTGEQVRVTATFKYVGPAKARNIRISLFHYEAGTTPSGFMNEIAGANQTKTLNFGPSDTPQIVTTEMTLTVGSEASGRDIGVYAKFTDVLTGFVYGENCTYGYYGIASVIPVVGTFSEFKISNVVKA